MTTTDSFESSSEHPRLTIPIANSDYITPLRNYQRVAIEFPPSPSPLTRLQHEQQSERHRTAAQNLRHFGALPGSWDPTFAPPFTIHPRPLHRRQTQMEQPSPQPLTQANVQSLERQAEAMASAQSQVRRPASVRAQSLITPEQFSDAQLLAEAERLQQMVRNRQRAQQSIIKEESHEPEVEWSAPTSEPRTSGYSLSALPPLPASTTSGNTPSTTRTQVDRNSLPKRDPYIDATSSQFNEYARQRVAAVVEAHEGQLRQVTHQNMMREYEEHLTRLAVQRQDMHGRTTYAIPPLAVNRFFAANMRHDGRLRSHPVDIRPDLGPFIPNRNDYENNLINEDIIPDGLLPGESRSDYLRRQISQQAIDAMSSGVSHSGPLDEAHLQGIEGRLIRMAMLERLRLHDIVNVGRSNISEQGVLLTRDNRATHPNFPGIVVHIPDYVSQPDKYTEIRAWIPAPLREPPPDRDPSDGGDSSHGGHGNGPPNRGPPRPPGGPGNPGGGPPNPPGGPPNGPPNPPGNSPPGSNHDAASNNSNRGNPPRFGASPSPARVPGHLRRRGL